MKLHGEPRRRPLRTGDMLSAAESSTTDFEPQRDISARRTAAINEYLEHVERKLEKNILNIHLLDDLSILLVWQFVDPERTQCSLTSLEEFLDRNWAQLETFFRNESKRGKTPHSWPMLENVFIYLCHLLPHRAKELRQLLIFHEGNLQMPDSLSKQLCAKLLNPGLPEGNTPLSVESLKMQLLVDKSKSDWKAYARTLVRATLLEPSILKKLTISADDKKGLLNSLGRNVGAHAFEQEGWILLALVFLSAEEVHMNPDGLIRVVQRKQLKKTPPLPERQV